MYLHDGTCAMMKTSMSGRTVHAAVYGGSLAVLLLQFFLIGDPRTVHTEWAYQFYFLAAMLAALFVGLTSSSHTYRRHVFLAFIVAASVLLAVPFRSLIQVRIILLILVVVAGRSSDSAIAIVIATGVYLGSLLFSIDLRSPWYPTFTRPTTSELASLFFFGSVLAAFAIGDLLAKRSLVEAKFAVSRLRGSVEELSKANRGYISFVQFARTNSALEERKRITREIHDGIGYSLTNVMMLSQVANEECLEGQSQLKKLLEAIRVQAKTGLFDTRRALRFLRSAEAELPHGIDAIRKMLEVFEQATSVEVAFRLSVRRGVVEHEAVFSTVYRFVQEALTNAFRHGHATRVEITFLRDGSWLVLTVHDNGVGAKSIEPGIGFQGMEERLSVLGGSLYSHSRGGFTVSAKIPIQPETHDENTAPHH